MNNDPWQYHPLTRRIDTDIAREQTNHVQSIAVRLIDIFAGFLITVLLSRFVLMLVGANPENGLAAFVYGFSAPFVAPFAGLLSYDHFSYGVSHFEAFTLLAAGFYSLLAGGLRKLATVAWW
jgi:hypothetical protein